MPEGHTIHHLCRKLDRWFSGQVVSATSPQGRFAAGAASLNWRRLEHVEAKGKHALLAFEERQWLHVHLGLYGRTRFFKNEAPEPRGAVRLRLIGETRTFDLVGPTCCEILADSEVRALRRRLGPDPLRSDSRLGQFRNHLQKTRRKIGVTLLDQSVVAGLGNVYRSELLFLGGLNPWTPSNQLSDEMVQSLWRNAVTLLRVGAKENRITVLGVSGVRGPKGGGAVDPNGHTIGGRYGPRKDRLWVYKRKQCKVCEASIETAQLGQRKLFWCPECQNGRNARSTPNPQPL